MSQDILGRWRGLALALFRLQLRFGLRLLPFPSAQGAPSKVRRSHNCSCVDSWASLARSLLLLRLLVRRPFGARSASGPARAPSRGTVVTAGGPVVSLQSRPLTLRS